MHRMLSWVIQFLPLALALPTPVLAQAPALSQTEGECVVRAEYPMLTAAVAPADQRAALPVVRLYFRAAQHPDFYWVRMTPTPTGYQAVLPVPAPETTELVTYVEAVLPDFTTVRTPDRTVAVVDRAEQCPQALVFSGEDPAMVLTATTASAPALPPGFVAGGIAGTVTGPAAVAAAGAGTAPGWLLPVAIAGGFGSVLLLDQLDDDDDEPVSLFLP